MSNTGRDQSSLFQSNNVVTYSDQDDLKENKPILLNRCFYSFGALEDIYWSEWGARIPIAKIVNPNPTLFRNKEELVGLLFIKSLQFIILCITGMDELFILQVLAKSSSYFSMVPNFIECFDSLILELILPS